MAESSQVQAMRKLGFTDEEIKSVQAYDAEIDKGADPLPLPPNRKRQAEKHGVSGKKPFTISRRGNAKRTNPNAH